MLKIGVGCHKTLTSYVIFIYTYTSKQLAMNKFFTLASATLLAASALLSTSCSTNHTAVENTLVGNGPVGKKSFKIKDFSEVNAGHQFDVKITTGENYSVTVKAPSDVFRYLDISKNGARLAIDWNTNDNKILNQLSNKKVQVMVSMPALDKASAYGQSSFIISGDAFGNKLVLDAANQSVMKLKDSFKTDMLTVTMASQTQVSCENITTKNVSISTASQSQFSCKDIVATDVTVECSSQSEANIGSITATYVNLTTGSQSNIRVKNCKAENLDANASSQSAITVTKNNCRSVSRSTSNQATINI